MTGRLRFVREKKARNLSGKRGGSSLSMLGENTSYSEKGSLLEKESLAAQVSTKKKDFGPNPIDDFKLETDLPAPRPRGRTATKRTAISPGLHRTNRSARGPSPDLVATLPLDARISVNLPPQQNKTSITCPERSQGYARGLSQRALSIHRRKKRPRDEKKKEPGDK